MLIDFQGAFLVWDVVGSGWPLSPRAAAHECRELDAAMGHSRTSARATVSSALPSRTDICWVDREVLGGGRSLFAPLDHRMSNPMKLCGNRGTLTSPGNRRIIRW